MSAQRRTLIALSSVLLIFLASTILATSLMFTSTAQDDPTEEPGVEDGPRDPNAEATGEAYHAQIMAELSRRNIFDFNVAYLIAPDIVQPENLVSEQTFEQIFGAQVVHSWDDLIALDSQHPLQIILIHNSISDQVDIEWLSEAYRNHILIVGISIPYKRLAEMVGDRCLKNPGPLPLDKFENIWSILRYSAELEDESYRSYLTEQTLEACNDNFELGNTTAAVYHSFVQFPITRTEDVEMLVGILISTTIEYRVTGNRSELIEVPEMQMTPLTPGQFRD